MICGVIAAAYVVLIASILWRGHRLRGEVAASQAWPTAASRVVESRMDELVAVKGGPAYFPVVVYDYTVTGRTLRGSRLHFGDPVGFSFRKRADRRLATLTAAAVQVYYDPADPTQVVIERTAPVLRREVVLLVILLAVLTGFLALVAGFVVV